MPVILLHLLPASLYALLGLHFWRSRWLQPALGPRQELLPWERGALLAALGAHGFALHHAFFASNGMVFGFSLALSLMLWLAVLFYWIESLYARLDGLQALAMPAAALCALLPAFFPEQHVLENAHSPLFRAHFVVAMLAYSLFTLAALHALLMSVAERRLHGARLSRAFASLPPLLTMEALLFRLIGIAFVLLTLTVGSGVLFSEVLFGRAFRFDHKTVFAILSWLIFGGLLIGRHTRGWRGRKALRWTLAGFVALMLAYVGSRFVAEVLLGRAA
ncbi:MAG TPA: cytochrome c biogenesis protein CcsA [Zoogloea sp.]|uniref:cytochrome C assembly family protein n=1 Tax=Zoogloea sp. TaxID=49181 RepID=UPI002C6722C4|nr:cytochrome c biogenesis protein CcsA [Zoogloea sp.]HMV17276.1 cytochrome c biogenesis protein CcsA [Rhodocyclaceae bacterium]HMW51223.1 cytochrome c biogenesis protein CcsA [Rhodocyclaceae bacterium]HMY50017.1 cytochrome c biogenesis protein CcsA [Rhodocyclaceae bacterium]HNA67142.1 cytochrome c biogenesis protein CcsA [Rhodocyclaceae bacterium]HNB64534.1 cytochrome c biogenesis protein CcsA [Rhodocyclaceae bacterium]